VFKDWRNSEEPRVAHVKIRHVSGREVMPPQAAVRAQRCLLLSPRTSLSQLFHYLRHLQLCSRLGPIWDLSLSFSTKSQASKCTDLFSLPTAAVSVNPAAARQARIRSAFKRTIVTQAQRVGRCQTRCACDDSLLLSSDLPSSSAQRSYIASLHCSAHRPFTAHRTTTLHHRPDDLR
jgi:hypothetical protein